MVVSFGLSKIEKSSTFVTDNEGGLATPRGHQTKNALNLQFLKRPLYSVSIKVTADKISREANVNFMFYAMSGSG